MKDDDMRDITNTVFNPNRPPLRLSKAEELNRLADRIILIIAVVGIPAVLYSTRG